MVGMTEAAQLLGISTKTLKRWCDRRLVPHYRIGPGSHRKFLRHELEGLRAGERREKVTIAEL
jgi:excisionase family DNA binding protein